MENLSGDAFILLINLFNDNETPKLLKKEDMSLPTFVAEKGYISRVLFS